MNSAQTTASARVSGPPGLSWLWRLFYGHSFWGGFGTALCMSPLLMLVLIKIQSGHIPSWQEQYKSFIIGDPLLAIIGGLLAVLVQKKSSREYVPPKHYWSWWLVAGLVGSVTFITNVHRKGQLNFLQLLRPDLFYHHIILITLMTALLGGMTYIQYRRHPRHILWLAILAVLMGFVALVVLDTVHPPLKG